MSDNDGEAKTALPAHFNSRECQICFESLGTAEKKRFMPCCGETLCIQCSKKWAKQCAFCRTPETHDPVEIVNRARKRAEAGCAAAQFFLGSCNYDGHYVAQDHTEAARWFRLAADQGNAEAQCNLGNSYCKGEGVVQDDAEAVRWYRLAADQSYVMAQCNLGKCYFNGWGVVADFEVAAQWFKLAAQQGHEGAKADFRIAIGAIKDARSK